MKRMTDEVREWPTWSKWLAALFLLLLLLGLVAPGSDSSRSADSATTERKVVADAQPPEPKQTLEDAAAKVDDGDYKGAVLVAAALPDDDEDRVRRKISRHLARSVGVALRAGDRSQARRLLPRASRFPRTRKIVSARADYRAAQARAAARAERHRLARVAARRRAAERRGAARRRAAERRAARRAARERELALAAAAPEEPTGGDCHSSYSPCIPTDRDYDCGELSGPYTVSGPDEYRLDADNDRVGCE